MPTTQTDSLGRATFHHIKPRSDVRPTAREIRWLKHIERHGPQSSEFLFELTRDTHRSKDTSLRDLQKLRAGGFLRLPPQQRAAERAEFNPYIYDLTKQAYEHLNSCDLAEPTVRPTGHWWHAYATAAFTGTLEVFARQHGRTYIPAHTILARAGAELPIPLGRERLIPDQLFAIRYDDGYRAFLLEVDRATEPLRSTSARKSLGRSIAQYAEVLVAGRHSHYYGLRANTAILFLFTEPARIPVFQAMVRQRAGPFAGQFLCKVLPSRLAWRSLRTMHRRAWASGSGGEVLGL